jgi:hypothetical protein
LDALVTAVLNHLAAGGSGVAWALVAYLLLRIHQLTDRQHKANLDVIEALSVIKNTLLTARRKPNGR